MGYDKMRDLLALSELKRWNVVPTTRDQTVAQHSFGVAVIAMEIAERLKIHPDYAYGIPKPVIDVDRVIRWSLVHDGPECITGDLPSNLKRFLTKKMDLNELEYELCPWYEAEDGTISAFEQAIVSIADSIEAGQWLSQWGAPGTRDIVDELKCKANNKSKETAEVFGLPMLYDVAMEVAGDVWKGEIPMLLEKGRK